MEERLREAAALGDLKEVQDLLRSGVDVNSQNEINGWTPLHWACKRNQVTVVSILLESGADKNVLTNKGERPELLTSKREIKKILGVEDLETEDAKPDTELPFVPNYLANPPFPYTYKKEPSSKESHPATPRTENGSSYCAPQTTASFPLVTNGMENIHISTSTKKDDSLPALLFNGDVQIQQECTHSPIPNGGSCQPSIPQGRSMFSSVPSNLQHSGVHTGPMQVFQPFFFTGAFPSNLKELVLKVRIQNSAVADNDFIEVEMDREELTYRELLRVCCYELGVGPEQVEKIRKLPNTIIRKDKDVARLQDFQELELVLRGDSSIFRTSASLTERPCFNKKASKLTY
uniref:Ankyrin repeat domain 40 n=1 Tax=Leptobrachium leishanense TaxID=445787 RepID=A0A8C5QEE3_9ANUR